MSWFEYRVLDLESWHKDSIAPSLWSTVKDEERMMPLGDSVIGVRPRVAGSALSSRHCFDTVGWVAETASTPACKNLRHLFQMFCSGTSGRRNRGGTVGDGVLKSLFLLYWTVTCLWCVLKTRVVDHCRQELMSNYGELIVTVTVGYWWSVDYLLFLLLTFTALDGGYQWCTHDFILGV